MRNEERLTELRTIDSLVYKNMGKTSQLVIDFVQESIIDLSRDFDESPITRDELGSLSYQIDCLLEIFNPKKLFDIFILDQFKAVIDSWYNDVVFIDGTLGVKY